MNRMIKINFVSLFAILYTVGCSERDDQRLARVSVQTSVYSMQFDVVGEVVVVRTSRSDGDNKALLSQEIVIEDPDALIKISEFVYDDRVSEALEIGLSRDRDLEFVDRNGNSWIERVNDSVFNFFFRSGAEHPSDDRLLAISISGDNATVVSDTFKKTISLAK